MNLKEYYKYYLTLHKDIRNVRMHVLGQFVTIFFIIGCLLFNTWLLILTPFIVYPFAWTGHYYFEKNKPAAFSDPIKAKICDWIMLKDYVTNNLNTKGE